MAAVSISPQSSSQSIMSGRRVPLGNNPNGANSPFRPMGSVATKQKRSYANIQREENYSNAPPAKKQMLSSHQSLRTPPRQSSFNQTEIKIAVRKAAAPQQATYDRGGRTVVRERSGQQTILRASKTVEQNAETITAWQKHYRHEFPKYTFYFEGLTDDARHKFAKQVTSLGAHVERFFSNKVTHVVTTRTIPPELLSDTKGSSAPASVANDLRSENGQPRTINPSLLDRSSESYSQLETRTKGKFTFEAPLNRSIPHQTELEVRVQPAKAADVLHKARSLGMKIYTLEKLQRVLGQLLETNGSQILHRHDARGSIPSGTRAACVADLSKLLRDERINGPSDRDPTVETKEITYFKGPFIYIHDIDERQKPIMVREYTKVPDKTEGDWPQFRSVANGKCPFVDDDLNRKEAEREKQAARAAKAQTAAPRTRAATAAAAGESARMEPPKAGNKQHLAEMNDGSNRSGMVYSNQSNPFDGGRSRRDSAEASSTKGNAFISRAGGGARLFHGEPVASGIQPSNITSAIRSTMISSTAAAPGAKAGTNREIHGLQRKVLEKNSVGGGSFGAAAHRSQENTTVTRRRQANLEQIDETGEQAYTEEKARKTETARKAKSVQQRKSEKRDAKPGYCENCQDKFEDFDEHILSRKHRKFADRNENWKELDDLLSTLVRPLRKTMDD
ncbi:Dfp1/Him1, central region-domain-containing protein [Calycina marina]|uniref:Dfp1/Him1, central region-domain-containing protein n=1 Tax=Calycina marina TaxID=1763456 RepID=A0A9P7Z7X3_9HELO|nr:Dfp1/Him1, central region-domain-containing protein [Calycina marina]